jgi:hypothetical protein
VAFLCGGEKRERGIDEKAPSISPMKGECSTTTWDSWVAFLCGASHSYWIDQKGGVTKYC